MKEWEKKTVFVLRNHFIVLNSESCKRFQKFCGGIFILRMYTFLIVQNEIKKNIMKALE
jgi:hypothetical protein